MVFYFEIYFNLKKSKYPYAEEIGPGWISAMGSAHAISVTQIERSLVLAATKTILIISFFIAIVPKNFVLFIKSYTEYEKKRIN